MEYVEGSDLESPLDYCEGTGRTLPLEAAAYVAAMLAEGLHYSRALTLDDRHQQLVHRDVSPAIAAERATPA